MEGVPTAAGRKLLRVRMATSRKTSWKLPSSRRVGRGEGMGVVNGKLIYGAGVLGFEIGSGQEKGGDSVTASVRTCRW